MIGDRLNIDIAFGSRAGFKTLLVETGDHNMENIAEVTEKDFIPDYVIESLGKFLWKKSAFLKVIKKYCKQIKFLL